MTPKPKSVKASALGHLLTRRQNVLEENSWSLSMVIVATAPLFAKGAFDVAGDDDRALINISYDDWAHLLEVMQPFHPHEIKALKRRLFPHGKHGDS